MQNLTALLNRQLMRFSIVGVLITATHIGIAYLAHHKHGFDAEMANRIGFLFSVGLSYYLHHRWTFSLRGDHALHISRFSTAAILSYVVSHLITFVTIQVLNGTQAASLMGVAAIVPFGNYLVSKYWALHPRTANDQVHWGLLGLAVSVAIVVQVWTVLYGTPFNHDTSWYFVAVRMWLAGAPLYAGVMEINPPLFFYFIRAVLTLGSWLNLSDEIALRSVLFILGIIAVRLAYEGFRSIGLSVPQKSLMVVFSMAALFVVPLSNFGQREHLFLVLLLPYLVSFGARVSGQMRNPRMHALCVILFIIGMLLKPYFVVLPIGLSVYALLFKGRDRQWILVDLFWLAVSGALYVVFVFFAHPEYFSTIAPLGRLVYASYENPSVSRLVEVDLMLVVPTIFSVMLFFMHRRNDKTVSQFGAALLVGSVSLLAIYLIQLKGWTYQVLPFRAVLFLLAGYLLVISSGWVLRILSVVALVLVWTPVIQGELVNGPYFSSVTREAKAILGQIEGKKLMFFTSNVSGAFPLVNQSNLVWTSRYPTQWIVPGAFVGLHKCQVDRCGREPAFEAALVYARETATEDFIVNQPDIVLVDIRRSKSYFSGMPFDWLQFMSEDTRFAQAWTAYVHAGNGSTFEVWRRKL